VDRAAKALHFGSEGSAMLEKAAAAGDLGLDPSSPRVRMLAALVRRMEGFPRHLSIHVGGMIITRDPLSCVVPIENAAMKDRTVVQWDKDDVSRVGLVKIDLLGLGMLTLIQEAIGLVKRHEDIEVDLAHLPMDDPQVYDMLCCADTVGVFQVESRAQMNTLPRVKPRCFYDLVIEIALIRPGPIQGDMVHPYLRRRAGREKVTYLHPSLEPVLKRTLGVPLFQEQGMKVAVAAAGFTPSEADELRRAMGFKRSTEAMKTIAHKLTLGMRRNKIPDEAAEKIHKQLTAFASYGFPESHAASFALLVYASAYLKHHHPLAFTCALLNAQPMGFYSPSTIVQDARRHGVHFLPVNVRASEWDCTLEGGAVRIGFRYVRGIGEETKEPLCAALQRRPFTSIEDFVVKTGLSRAALDHLAELGAFDDFSLDRRQVLWRLLALAPHLTVLRGAAAGKSQDLVASSIVVEEEGRKVPGASSPPARRDDDDGVRFRPMTRVEETEADYALTGLSTKRHPLEFLREDLAARGVLTAVDLRGKRHGERVLVAGLAICRQHPGTAKGFTFLTLEDETGMINVVVRPRYFEKYRLVIRLSPILLVSGILEREDGVINVLGDRFEGQDELAVLRQDMARKVPARDFR
jgi:error-prone DNA polymerase